MTQQNTENSGKEQKEYVVYILVCKDGSFYTGITNDPEKRLRAHNNGTGSKYTRTRRPVGYIYMEAAGEKSAALKRELQIKALSREEKRALINGPTNLMKYNCVEF